MLSFLQVRNQYQIIYKIDSQKYSDIFIARCIPNNNVVTIKIYNLDDPNFDSTKCNLQILNKGTSYWLNKQHPNLIQYYGSFLCGYQLWSISEFMDCGSCTDALRQLYPNGIDNEILISTIIKSVLTFISSMHKDNKVYQRICPSNIFLSALGNVKMDLICTTGKYDQNDQYIAPEIKEETSLNKKKGSSSGKNAPPWAKAIKEHKKIEKNDNSKKDSFSEKIDIYDIGITCIELATGKSPGNDVIELVRSKSSLPNRNNFSSSFFDFVNSCIKVKASKRPTAEQLLQHKFIKSAQDSNYLKAMLTSLLLPLNQQHERLKPDEKNLDEYIHFHSNGIKCSFEIPNDEISKSSDENINTKKEENKETQYPKKKIGRITLAGPENSLKEYL